MKSTEASLAFCRRILGKMCIRDRLKGRLEWQLQRRKVQADILEYESGETFLEAARKAPFTCLLYTSPASILIFGTNYERTISFKRNVEIPCKFIH